MINLLIALIPIAILPLFSNYVYYWMNKYDYKIDIKSVGIYAIFVGTNFTISKLLYFVLCALLSLEESYYSFQFIFISLLVSFISPIVLNTLNKNENK